MIIWSRECLGNPVTSSVPLRQSRTLAGSDAERRQAPPHRAPEARRRRRPSPSWRPASTSPTPRCASTSKRSRRSGSSSGSTRRRRPSVRGRPPVRWRLTHPGRRAVPRPPRRPHRRADRLDPRGRRRGGPRASPGRARPPPARGVPDGAPRSGRQQRAGPGAAPRRPAQRRGLPGRGRPDEDGGMLLVEHHCPVCDAAQLPGPVPVRARAVPGGPGRRRHGGADPAPAVGRPALCLPDHRSSSLSSRSAHNAYFRRRGLTRPHDQRSSGGSSLGPTWASSHAVIGLASRHRPSTRSLALAVCNQAAPATPARP